MFPKLSVTIIILLAVFFSNSVSAQNSSPKKLNVMSYLVINETEQNLGEDSLLKNYFKIESIDKSVFDAKQKTEVNFLIVDTNKIKKDSTTLKLPLTKGFKIFTDKNVDDETHTEFFYIGQIPVLNSYIVEGLYWEDLDFQLISKTTGEEICSFGDVPYISADKKHIIAIYANPYETTADLYLYKIVNNKPVIIMSAGFKNWMPATHKIKMFWSSDGKLYVPYLPSDKFWKEDGNYSDDFRYLRITLL